MTPLFGIVKIYFINITTKLNEISMTERYCQNKMKDLMNSAANLSTTYVFTRTYIRVIF